MSFVPSNGFLFIFFIASEVAYSYTLLYVRSIPSESPSSQTAAVEAIRLALTLASIFNFDPLLQLEAVQKAKSHPLFSLFQIFTTGDYKQYCEWLKANNSLVQKSGMDFCRRLPPRLPETFV